MHFISTFLLVISNSCALIYVFCLLKQVFLPIFYMTLEKTKFQLACALFPSELGFFFLFYIWTFFFFLPLISFFLGVSMD